MGRGTSYSGRRGWSHLAVVGLDRAWGVFDRIGVYGEQPIEVSLALWQLVLLKKCLLQPDCPAQHPSVYLPHYAQDVQRGANSLVVRKDGFLVFHLSRESEREDVHQNRSLWLYLVSSLCPPR